VNDAAEVHLAEIRFGQMKRLGAQAIPPGFRILARVTLCNERSQEAMRGADVKPDLLAQFGDADLAPAVPERIQQRERSGDGLDRLALPLASSALRHLPLSHENAPSFSLRERSLHRGSAGLEFGDFRMAEMIFVK